MNFKNLKKQSKNEIFLKMRKNLLYTKFQLFGVLSSPKPNALGELIVCDSSRRPSVCLSIRESVHTFKHEYP